MKRKHTWQIDLAALLAARADMPFAWGSNDCCLFAADSVQAMTGVDHMQPFRGYQTARQALEMLAKEGGLHQAVLKALGPDMPVGMAAVGDVLLMHHDDRELLAICNGATALAPGKNGLVTLPIAQAMAAWRVGDV